MIRVGDERYLVRSVTSDDVKAYASVSGDNNPLHMDSEFSKKSNFGRRISHGNLIIGLFTGMIALDFPGPGTILISQDLHFKAPIFVDSEIQLYLTVKKTVDRAGILYLLAECRSDNRLCIDGEFKVYRSGFGLRND
jgi:3-hydroxybutyryl-CoA dehydratase